MARYHDINMVRDYRGSITTEVCHAIVRKIGVDGILEVFKNNTDPAIARRVQESVNSIITGSKLHLNGLREPEAPVSPSVTSCKSSEEWITAKEAAEILGRGERTVSNYRSAGDITGRKKDGKTWEYDKASVEAFALQLQLKAA